MYQNQVMHNSKFKLNLQKMFFDVKNECVRKKFQECHTRDFFLSRTQKESILSEIFLDVNF
jgi:hypothetical protein